MFLSKSRNFFTFLRVYTTSYYVSNDTALNGSEVKSQTPISVKQLKWNCVTICNLQAISAIGDHPSCLQSSTSGNKFKMNEPYRNKTVLSSNSMKVTSIII
jgi:hypothetical protein